jgi:3-hydroxyisobutyrate dehydrogenase
VTNKPTELAGHEIIVVMVNTDAQVIESVDGPEGILEAVDTRRPPMLMIMSTILPETTQQVARLGAEKNVRVIDAAVSGLPLVAEQGKLSIMVGGEPGDLQAMMPVLKTLGERIYHVGPLGAGNVTKLVNNMIGAAALYLAVESLELGKKYGLSPDKLAEIIEASSGRNFLTKDWVKGKAILDLFSKNSDSMKSNVDICIKDMNHAQKLARNSNVGTPILDQVIEVFKKFNPEDLAAKWRSILS